MINVMILLSCDACSKCYKHTSSLSVDDVGVLNTHVDQLRGAAKRHGWETGLNERYHYCSTCWHELGSFTEPYSVCNL